MQIFSKNLYNNLHDGIKSSLNFKGKGIPFDSAIAVAKRAACKNGKLQSVYNTLVDTTQKKAPELIEQVDDVFISKEETLGRKLIEAGRDFLELPLDLLDDIVSHFPNSRLNNLGILQKHREHILDENRVKAFQGLFDYGPKFLNDVEVNAGKIAPPMNGDCTEGCRTVCDNFAKKFNEQLNSSVELNKSIYDSKKERFNTRMISGLTAALFLGNDFYNSAILKGKSEEEAKKAQRKKQGQEIKENVIEGFAQYGVMACFAKQASSNLWFNVLSGTGVSLLARIISRKISGMPLTRMKAPENSMAEFVKAAKNKQPYKTQSEKDKEAKKPILSIKNLVLLCVGIIGAGFALKKLGTSTDIGKAITKKIDSIKEKSYKNSVEEILATPEEIQNIVNIANKYGEPNLVNDKLRKKIEQLGLNEEFTIGEKYKVIKLPGGLTVTQRALKKALLAPFKMVKEFITYPYKLATKFTDAMSASKATRKIRHAEDDVKQARKVLNSLSPSSVEFSAAQNKVLEAEQALEDTVARFTPKKKRTGSEKLLDDFYFKNIYIRYKKFEEKFGSDPQRLEEEFGKYIQKARAASMNNKTSSKIDNSQIAVLAQITGTLTGIGFNMNDEYNAAIKNGDNKQDAEKAARKRGLNKFARMTSQVAISEALNKLFKAQYQGSLLGAGIIVAISTVITDMVSRVLTAMPTKKMSKEELEQYQHNHKTGKMAWYYNMIDKLAS